MLISNRISGLLLAALGGAAWYGGSLLPPVPGQQVGPNVFPMVVGGGLVLCGAMIALGVGEAMEREAEADVIAHSDPEMLKGGGDSAVMFAVKTLLPPTLLLFYVFAVERIGFVPTAATIIFLTALAMKSKLKIAIPLALIAPFVAHLIFAKLLRVPLPQGLVPMPW